MSFVDYTDPDVRAAQLALRQKARAGKAYDKPPIIPEIAKAYQADPRTRLALTALTNGTSTAPVAAGKYGIAEGIARALTAPLGAYIDKQQQQKYGGVTDDTLDKEDLRDRGAAQAQAALAANAAAAQAPPVADTPAPPQADPTALPPPQPQAPPPPPTAVNTGPPLPGGVNPAVANAAAGALNGAPPPGPPQPQGIGVVPGRTMAPIPTQGGVPVGTRPFAPPPAGLPPPVATAASVPSPAPVASAVSDTATRLAAAKTTLQAQGLKVNSGYRTPAHNAEVGGVTNSFHTRGTPGAPLAYDFSPAPGQTMAQAAVAAQAAAPGFKVINEGNHIHVQPPSGSKIGLPGTQVAAAAAPVAGPAGPEAIPDLPAVLSKPEAPTPVAARQSELLKAAYAIAQDRDEVAYSRGQDLKAAGLAEQDKMNESAAEREQRIADMGYQSGLSAYNQSVQDRAQYGYQQAGAAISGNRAAGVATTAFGRELQKEAITQAGQKSIEQMKIDAAKAKNDIGDLTAPENAETLTYMAQEFLAGNRGVAVGLGRGASGAKNVIALRTKMYQLAKDQGIPAAQIGARVADLAAQYKGEEREAQTTGGRVGATNVAVEEVGALAPDAKAAHKALNATSVVPWNKVVQAISLGTSSPQMTSAVAANNAIINAYARSFGNQAASVHAQQEAATTLRNAWGTPGYDAAVDKIVALTQKERGAAKAALRNVGTTSAPAAAPGGETDAARLKRYGIS